MKKIYFFINGIMSITMCHLFVLTNTVQAQLYINEFMASNDVSFPGPQGDYPDWIEIYNAGIRICNAWRILYVRCIG